MARRSNSFAQRDFSAGQITEAGARRDNVKLVRRGVKQGRNIRLLNTGGYGPRFGRTVILPDAGRTDTIRFTDTLKFKVTFGDESILIRDSDDEIVFTADGMPWTQETLRDIKFDVVDRDVIITYQNVRPRTLRYGRGLSLPATDLIGDMTDFSGLAAAFNGVTNEIRTVCAAKNNATSAYIGIDVAGFPQRVGQVLVWPSSNQGFVNAQNPSVTLTLRARNGSAPSSASDGTSLGTTTFTDSTAARSITSSDTSTQYDYIWLQVTHAGSAASMSVAEVAFLSDPNNDIWTTNAWRFASGIGGETLQPYYRYAPRGITFQPSDVTGEITGAFSAPVLQSGHVGVSFRYHDREMVCTGITSPTDGSFLVIQELPKSRIVNVASGEGIYLGQILANTEGTLTALIVSRSSATQLNVVMLKGVSFANGITVVTETASTTVSSTNTLAAQASVAWDEAAMSDVRGWPASVSTGQNRLIFTDFRDLPSAIGYSAIGLYDDMKIGANAPDGFLELVPNNARVRNVLDGADQIVFTDLGIWYIPISESNPLRPGSVAFKFIGAVGASGVTPVKMQQGMVYVASSGRGIMAVVPTGQQTSPWSLQDISEYHADIITEPVAMAVTASGAQAGEQYLRVAMADGTGVTGRFDQSNDWVGFVPFDGEGLIEWISAFGSEVFMNVLYENAAGDIRLVETIDEATFLDGGVFVNGPPGVMAGDPGDGPLWMFAGMTVDVMEGNIYYGSRVVDAGGEIVEESGDDFSGATVVAGFRAPYRVKLFVPNMDEGPAYGQRLARRRVKRAAITVQDSTGFTFMGRAFNSTDNGDEPGLVSTTYRASGKGRYFDPEVTFEKDIPGPFRVIEIGGEVTI